MHYFDTSFITPLLLGEATSERVEAYVRRLSAGTLAVSQWTRIEFASLVAREVRTGGLNANSALAAAEQFEILLEESFEVVMPEAADYELARRYILKFHTGLRAGDAIHLAIAANHEANRILTLDRGMLKAGRILKLPVSAGIRV